ncbi:MAG: hypothetical protein ABL997_21145 [Planctomycetota bacterium]
MLTGTGTGESIGASDYCAVPDATVLSKTPSLVMMQNAAGVAERQTQRT